MFLDCCQDCLKMKKTWKKRVLGCNSVAVKTIWKLSRTLKFPFPSLLDVKSFHPHPTCLLYMRVDYCGIYSNSKSKWHITCAFFYVKIFMHSTFIYNINLLKPNLLQGTNDTWCSIGLRHPMRSILEHEEELNYFDKFLPLLTQNKIFEITSMS